MQFISQINEIFKYACPLKKGGYMQMHNIIRGLPLAIVKVTVGTVGVNMYICGKDL